jgi:hypothetical protein
MVIFSTYNGKKIGLEKGTHPFCVKHLYIRSRNGLEPSRGPQFIIESISSFITTNDLFCNGKIQYFISECKNNWSFLILWTIYFTTHTDTKSYKLLQFGHLKEFLELSPIVSFLF